MTKQKEPHKKTTVGGGCKALLTLALLMLLSVVTAGKAAAQDPQAYAVLKDNTLTFYYDKGYESHQETQKWTVTSDPGWKKNTDITKVEITKDFHNFTPKSCGHWFDGLENLTEIIGIENINTSQVSYMGLMFDGCKKLTSLDLSSFNTENVSNMFNMFQGCEALTSLDLSSFNTRNVMSMERMFHGCSALTSLDLSSFNTTNVNSMEGMFYGCNKLTTILVGNRWTFQSNPSGNGMFQNCRNLVGGNGTTYLSKQITGIHCARIDGGETNPGYLTSLDQLKQQNKYSPYAILEDNGKTLKFYYGQNSPRPSGAMDLSRSYWGKNASNITKVVFDNLFKYASPTSCADWFAGFTNLTEIIGIGNLNTSKVTEVTGMQNMFQGCEKLTSLTIPRSFTMLGDGMFSNCGIKELIIKEGTDELIIPDGFLSSNQNIEKVSLPARVTEIGEGAFSDCSNLATVTIETENSQMTSIGSQAFSNCKSLKSFTIPESVTEIGGWAFSNCTALNQVTIPASVTSIGEAAFDCPVTVAEGNPNYTAVDGVLFSEDMKILYRCPVTMQGSYEIPESVTEIGGWAFSYCTALTSETIPAGVTFIGEAAFDCPVTVAEDNQSYTAIDGVLFSKDMTRLCRCPVTKKGLYIIPASATEILPFAFIYCTELTSVTIPASITTIGAFSFNACTNINDVFCLIDDPINITWEDAANDFNADKKPIIHVRKNADQCNTTIKINATFSDDINGALSIYSNNGETIAALRGDFGNDDESDLNITNEITVNKVTFYRSFTDGVTATVMFPFSFTADDKISGTFRTLSKVAPDDDGVWTAELSYPIKEIQANTPYIFSPSGNIESITFTGENGNGITLLPVTGDLTNGANDGWQLHGLYSKKIWTEDSKTEYGFAGEEADGIKAGEFVRAGEGAWADPMRCYLTYGNGNPFTTAKSSVVLPDRIRVVFPEDKDEDTGEEITTNPDEVITPVSPVTEEAVTKVWAYNRTIFIESPTGSEYTVIDINGRQIKASATESTHEEVNISKPGMYVVVINGKAYKLWLN